MDPELALRMHMQSKNRTIAIAFWFAAALLSGCSERSHSDKTASVRQFVQDFYNGYLAAAANPHTERAEILKSDAMRNAIQTDLLQLLADDYEVQQRNKEDIVGLDFDPFLAAQDPCERYEVANITRKDFGYWVDIHGIGGCEKHANADVVAEIVPKGQTWEFANFHYPGTYPTDLRTVLAKLRRNRE